MEFENKNIIEEVINIDGVENEEVEEIQPFDPEKISIDTKTLTMEGALRQIILEVMKKSGQSPEKT